LSVLTREQILAMADRKVELVPVPEWDGDVYLRVLTGTEVWEFQEHVSAKPDAVTFVARLLALCLCDERGAPLFTTDDLKALGDKSGVVLGRLYRVAMRLNRIGDQQVEIVKGN
jgi:hypothetical protein